MWGKFFGFFYVGLVVVRLIYGLCLKLLGCVVWIVVGVLFGFVVLMFVLVLWMLSGCDLVK